MVSVQLFKATGGSSFFFLMTLRVPLIHYVDISSRHSHTCLFKIMIINVQKQAPTHQMSQTSLNEVSFVENTPLSGAGCNPWQRARPSWHVLTCSYGFRLSEYVGHVNENNSPWTRIPAKPRSPDAGLLIIYSCLRWIRILISDHDVVSDWSPSPTLCQWNLIILLLLNLVMTDCNQFSYHMSVLVLLAYGKTHKVTPALPPGLHSVSSRSVSVM